jgi:predicted permease
MRLWHILRTRLRSLIGRSGRESELTEELQLHLERETERLRAGGLPADAARRQALRTFGSLEHVREECRDARGTVFVEDLVRDIFYALRTFKRAPLVALTIVLTVGLGLGLVAAAFTVLNALMFRFDAVPDVQEIFAVERPEAVGEPAGFTRDKFDAFRRETSFFSDVFAQAREVDSRVDGRLIFGTFVTGNFFQVLRVNAAIGRALTPADDEPPTGQPVVVLSHRGWDRLFARDPAVLGRRLLLNGVTFEIVGVMPEEFRGLVVVTSDEYWAPLSTLRHVRPLPGGGEPNLSLDIIGRLKTGTSRDAAVAQLAAWDVNQSDGRPIERGASRMTLVPRRGTVPQPLEAVPVTAPLFFAFGLILLIGCANVANLLLARAVARQREIGIRLSLGATRRRIVRQLLTESLLLALVAAAAGYAISRAALETIISAVMTNMPPDIGDVRLLVPDADWRVLLFLIAGAVVSTLAFALLPALQATRMEPIRTIRGEVVKDARPGRARNFLIGLQVSASALLLIAAAVFLRSAFTAATYDSGVRTSDTIVVRIANEPARNAIVQAVTAEPSVAEVAASWPELAPRGAFAESSAGKTRIAYKFVSPEYFSVLDIAVVRGRAFAPAERTSKLSVAIISETAARAIWPNADPVGQVVRLYPDPTPEAGSGSEASGAARGGGAPQAERAERGEGPPRLLNEASEAASQTFTVAGVVRDVAGLRIAPFDKAVVYVPTSEAMPTTTLIARVHGDPELARQTLLNRLTAIDPNMGREVTTLRTLAGMDTFFLQIAFWLTVVLGGLALALTLSGLFSVLSYLVEQRTKEIGVRMALGATAQHVTRLVLSQLLKPVSIGLLAGGASAAGLAVLLLATPAAATIGEIIHVLDPVAYAVSLIIIIAACVVAASIPAARAARLDPTRTLRQE